MTYIALFSLKKNSKSCSICAKCFATTALLFEESNFINVGLAKAFCDKCCSERLSSCLHSDEVLVGEKFFIKLMHFKENVLIYFNASKVLKIHALKDYTKLLKNATFQD